MFFSLLLIACDGTTQDTADTAPVIEALPEVWGVAPAEDINPDPNIVEVELTAAPMTVDWTEGGSTEVWAYNGQIPGPLIQARVGDTLRIHFTNNLDGKTTIHWHGLRIDYKMDGIPAIQDKVKPGETFTYEFVVPDAGSYWYHPHVRAHYQVEMGLQGLLVVHEDEIPKVSTDRYFTWDDVRLEEDGSMSDIVTSGMDTMHGRFGNLLLNNGSADLPLKDTIQAGSVERWRIVNTANARTMFFKVKGADWRIVGVDGGLLEEPYTTNRERLAVGQRFDLEVIPKAGKETVSLEMQLPKANGFGFDDYPMFEATVTGEAGELELPEWVPAVVPEVEEAQQEVVMEFNAEQGAVGLKWTINGETYENSTAIQVTQDRPSLVRIKNLSNLEHPFHLHGQFFQNVERNGLAAEEPGLRDTVLIEGGDEVLLYTGFENPGRWMAHCHILEHAEAGMMTEIVVSEGE
jgi:FtsP/CotA-like multicopper oxidase with cupredoxin domain